MGTAPPVLVSISMIGNTTATTTAKVMATTTAKTTVELFIPLRTINIKNAGIVNIHIKNVASLV